MGGSGEIAVGQKEHLADSYLTCMVSLSLPVLNKLKKIPMVIKMITTGEFL